MILKSLIGAGLLWVVLCSNGFAESTLGKGEPNYTAVAHDLVPTDTTVQTGTLPNGLRFALLHADHPKGGLSIRLGIDVGSFEEADDERGVAHFIEHMAFRSTRSYPDNSVDGAFTAAGVEFGRDHNAATDLFSTQFELDLPRATGAERNRAFTWLRDVADGVVFDLAAVDKERGVVLAEKEARNNEAQAAYDALQQFQAPGLRAFDRSAIGTDAVLKGVSAETLKAFYRRWYRPDNAIVVVVGDLTIDEMKVDIERAFGSWSVSGPKPERATYGALDTTRRLDTFTRADDSNFASIDVCRFSPSLPKTRWDYDRVRQEALRKIARQIINQRLLQSRLVAANQILGAQLSSEEDRDHRSICLSIKPTNGAWVPALAAGQAELLRFQKSGPTEFELEQAIDAVRAPLRGAISEADGRAAPILADDILSKMLDGEPLPEPRQRLRAYDLAVEHVTVADVRTAFDADWAGSGPLVSVIEPTAPTPAEVRQAWRANEQGSGLAAYTDLKPLTWGYAFGPPGETVSREHVMLGDFARFRFRNGVVLNFKRTQFRKRYASFVISFGSGRREIEKKDFLTAMIGGVIAVFGGVGKYSYEDLTRLTQSDLRTLAIHIGTESFSISSDELVANLEDKFKVSTALLSDPGFRPSLDRLLHEAIEMSYRLRDNTPSMAASSALAKAIAPGSPADLPPKAELLKVDSARVAEVLKPAMTQGQIDITIVGDIEEATAVSLVANTFGALPPRAAARLETADTFYLRYPQTEPSAIRVMHHGPPDKALAQVIWPLYVATPERRREEYSIKLLAAIFTNELRHKIRGDLGKTYAPSVASNMPDHADQGDLAASIESYPADLNEVLAATRSVAKALADGEITAAQLDAIRSPMLAQDRQSMETNIHWAAGLARSVKDAQSLHDILNFTDIISSIRLDEVKKAAADWLAQEPIVVIATPAQPDKEAGT